MNLFDLCIATALLPALAHAASDVIYSTADGPWSAPVTRAAGRVPGAGDRVMVRTGHEVVYDVVSEAAIRAVQVAGETWQGEAPHCHLLPPKPQAGMPTFPQLDPVDDLPPATVITRVTREGDFLVVQGETIDNGEVAEVKVNGVLATPLAAVSPQWTATVPAAPTLTAGSVDSAGNVEPRPHILPVDAAPLAPPVPAHKP